MRENPTLRLRREAMTELTADDLRGVAAGDVPSGMQVCEVITEVIRQSALPTCWCTPTCI